jgi:hypothetical protein
MQSMAIPPIVQRHAIYIAPANAIYTFIPKNACTTLRYAAIRSNISCSDLNDKKNSRFELDTALAQIHRYVASPEQIASATYRFIVLRCPWSRLSSVFLDKVVDGKRSGRAIRLNAENQRYSTPVALGLHALHRIGLIPYLDPTRFTFRQFVDLIAAPSGLEIDHHWTPQARLALETYDDVFGMYDLKTAFARISEVTGMKIQDTRDLSGHATHRLKLLCDKCYADIPLAELNQMKQAGYAPHHKAFYDSALQRIVKDLYEEDLEFYINYLGPEGLAFSAY